MKNTVYYLGAGASIQAIPTIDGLRERINELISYVQKFINTEYNSQAFSQLDYRIRERQNTLRVIKDDLEILYNESETHQTVDTLARRYFLKNEYENVKRLKRGLVTYFFFEQCIGFPSYKGNAQQLLDKRYDNLIASIAERHIDKIKLRDDIKIITWNYDLQIEHAIQLYTNDFINKIKIDFQIHPNQTSYNADQDYVLDENRFSMFKLNGNAFLDSGHQLEGLFGSTPHDINSTPNTSFNKEVLIGEYLVHFERLFPDGKITNADVFKYFNFAWEKDEKYSGFNKMIDSILNLVSNSERLIIIGYSFPFFNAEIDRIILSSFRPKEIIIQDLDPENIKNRLLELVPDFDAPITKQTPYIKFVLQEPGKYFPISAQI